MLKTPDSGQITSAADRVVALDRARTFITLLVVLYHAVINYTHFGIGGDRMRWLGFDLVVLFCDSFFMACMFFISGLFVHGSLSRRGASNYLAGRAFRLGVPFLVSIFVLMPIAYYRYYHQEFDFLHYYAHMVTTGPWSAGSAWFLWVLLLFDAIAAALFAVAPRAIAALGRIVDGVRDNPLTAFAAFVLVSILIYLPLRVSIGESHWSALGHYPIFIQTSRAPLYAGYFLAGFVVGAAGLRQGVLDEGGAIARRWRTWLAVALAGYAAILLLVYIHHSGTIDLRAPPLVVAHGLWCRIRTVQCCDDLHGAGVLPAFCETAVPLPRRHAEAGLRHLSAALHSADLAAIPGRRPTLAGLRQVSNCVHGYAVGELVCDHGLAPHSPLRANDLNKSGGLS